MATIDSIIWHLRCVLKGVKVVFPAFFTVLALASFLSVFVTLISCFWSHEDVPFEKLGFPITIVVIQIVRFLREVGEDGLLSGGAND